MMRALVRDVTALGLGLVMLAPAAASAQQQQEQQRQAGTCLEHVEAIERQLDERGQVPNPRGESAASGPTVSHLVEAARRFAEQGEEERCFEVVEDMATYLRRVATTPEVAHGGSSVVPDERPPLEDEPGGEGFAGVLEEPGSVDRPELREPGLGEPEEVEEAGLEETAEALRGTEGDEGAQGAAATDAGSTLREGVSPVQPLARGLEREGPVEPTSTTADRPLAELRVDDLVGMPLINNWGREIGTIEDLVVAERDPQSVYAVVSESGALGIAGDEGIVPLERLRVPTPMAVQLRLDGGTEGGGGDGVEGLADLPAYDPTGYQSLPRTQQLGEVTGAQGLTVE